MRLPLGIPLVVTQVNIAGPSGAVKVDLICDTGAAFTALAWSVLKVIGYDPAVAPDDTVQLLFPRNGYCRM